MGTSSIQGTRKFHFWRPRIHGGITNDRGKADPFASHDLEDIAAVILSRPMLAAECDAAPESIRHLIATATNALLSDPNAEELLHAQLNGLGTQAGNALGSVRAQLQRMAAPD